MLWSHGCFQLVQFGGKNTIRMLSSSKASKWPGALSMISKTCHPVLHLTEQKFHETISNRLLYPSMIYFGCNKELAKLNLLCMLGNWLYLSMCMKFYDCQLHLHEPLKNHDLLFSFSLSLWRHLHLAIEENIAELLLDIFTIFWDDLVTPHGY